MFWRSITRKIVRGDDRDVRPKIINLAAHMQMVATRTKDQAKITNIDTYVRSKIGMMKSTSLPEACAFHEKQTYELNKLSRRELDLSFPNRQVSASATSRSFSVRNILRSKKKSAQNSVCSS